MEAQIKNQILEYQLSLKNLRYSSFDDLIILRDLSIEIKNFAELHKLPWITLYQNSGSFKTLQNLKPHTSKFEQETKFKQSVRDLVRDLNGAL